MCLLGCLTMALAFFGLLAVSHRQLIEWVDTDGFLLTIFLGAVISGRLGFHVYRKSKGHKDSLDTRPWWDVF